MNGANVLLRIGHVEASARVLVDGTEAGTLLTLGKGPAGAGNQRVSVGLR
jgi:hypothetical protein